MECGVRNTSSFRGRVYENVLRSYLWVLSAKRKNSKDTLPRPMYECVFRIASCFHSTYVGWPNQDKHFKKTVQCMRKRIVAKIDIFFCFKNLSVKVRRCLKVTKLLKKSFKINIWSQNRNFLMCTSNLWSVLDLGFFNKKCILENRYWTCNLRTKKSKNLNRGNEKAESHR